MQIKQSAHVIILTASLAVLASCGGAKKGITPTAEVPVEPVVQLGNVAEFDGSPQQLTAGEADNGIGAFHPAGDRVVFQSNRDGRWQIFELYLSDNAEFRLMESEANDENPHWMLNGNGALFVSDRDGQGQEYERDIYSYNPEDGQVVRITNAAGDDWYPVPFDSESFLFLSERNALPMALEFARSNTIYRGFIDGREAVEFVSADFDPSCPAQLPDDKVLVRTKDGRLARYVGTDGSLEVLTPSDYRIGQITYNPVRNFAAFTARAVEPVYRLYLFDLNSKTLQACDTGQGEVRYPQFSPDGGSILFTQEVEGKFQLFLWKLAQ